MQLIIATSFSLLITFMVHIVLNGKRAHNSLFQHIVADTQHYTSLSAACLLKQRSMYSWKNFSIKFMLFMQVICLV